ncbi:Ras GTPase activating protein ira2 [Orbilia oligospora]|nr:Ras GTPase activating protein ira2 [Orbilia oligospora]
MSLTGGLIGVIPAIEKLLTTEESGPIRLSTLSLIIWSLGLAFFGVIYSVPLRKQLIVRERLKFPSGTATATMISLLHNGQADIRTEGLRQRRTTGSYRRIREDEEETEDYRETPLSSAPYYDWRSQTRILGIAFGVSAIYTLLTFFLPVLRNLPIFGYEAAQTWLWALNPSPAYIGQGIIMGQSTTLAMLFGAIIGWGVLSPLAKNQGWAPGIVNDWKSGSRGWIVWISLAIMLADSVVSLSLLAVDTALPLMKTQLRRRSFLRRYIPISMVISVNDDGDDQHEKEEDAPSEEQIGFKTFIISLLLTTLLCILTIRYTFPQVPIYLTIVSLGVAFVLSVMAARALGQTDLNPVSGISKISQLFFALIVSKTTSSAVLINLVAGAVSEAAGQQAGDILQDLKTSHLLYASPKAQFYGQLVGAAYGAVISSLLYRLYDHVYTIPSKMFEMPAAIVWIDCSRLLYGEGLPPHAKQFCHTDCQKQGSCWLVGTMDENKLIQTLLDRLSAKLPNRSGDEIDDLRRDEIVTTLVELSKSHIEAVATDLIRLVDTITPLDTSRPRLPPLVVLSQTFLAELLADCLSAHWDSNEEEEHGRYRNEHGDPHQGGSSPRVSPLTARKIRRIGPPPLNEHLAQHMLDLVLRLSPNQVTTDESVASPAQPTATARNGPQGQSSEDTSYVSKASDLDKAVFGIMEYLSASNWSLVFLNLQKVLKQLRQTGSDDVDANGIQLLAHVWINSKQLTLILIELTAAFYHVKKQYQQLIAQLLPEAILKWIDTHPQEFVNLHLGQRRLEGGADVLFDITYAMADTVKRRVIFWPMQTTLLLLIPEVFLGSMLGDTARNPNTRRINFLEGLRKTLRLQRSADTAASCLVTICRAASYFDNNPEIAILSFALDVQNEMKEEIFKRKFDEDTALDRDIMVKAFVSLCHLSKDQVVENLLPRLLDRASHLSYKVVVFTGAAIIASQDRTNSFLSLYQTISPDVRNFLYTVGNAKRNNSVNSNNGVSRRVDNQSSESLLSSELLHQLLELLKIRPNLLFEGASREESSTFFEKTLSCILNCASEDDTLITKLSTEFARRLISRETTSLSPNNAATKTEAEVQIESWKGASATLVTFSRKLLDYDLSDPTLKVMLGLVRDYMETRLNFLKSPPMKNLIDSGADVAERQIAGISLEVSFLVLLCSSDLDICSLITSAINILCEEGRLTENMEDLERSGLSVMKNYAVYSELSSPNFRMTGPVAFQKRLRKLLVRMIRPTAGILTAWEAVFTKWKTLCKVVVSGSSSRQSAVDERTLVEWRNYSGFLAALGGCCISPPPQEIRPDDASVAGLRWIDRLAPDGDPYSLLERFMRQCLQLLVCSSLNVREAIREVLGSEMNPRLYVSFFRSLEIELNSVFENNPNAIAQSADGKLLFAEQSTSLLRAIIDRVEDTQESLIAIDFGALTLILAKFLHNLKDDASALRAKVKMCQLVEVVARKKDLLDLRQDIRVRNSLLQILVDWMSRLGKSEQAVGTTAVRRDEIGRLRGDLDRAALKALVNLLARLPLQPTESHDADALDAKSQLFCNYFTTFLNLLENSQHEAEKRRDQNSGVITRDDSSSTLELAILALSNLLSANVDVGLKFSLEIGYHENIEIRTAFMHVLTNILTQGTEFSSLGDSAIGEKYERMIQLLVNNFKFVLALCHSCPTSEIDEIAFALLNIFDSKGLGLTLLKELIEQEVANTESESELLRRNCVATKMLSVFAKWKGANYLRQTLQKVLEKLLNSADELDFELDPARTSSPEELQRNALQLRFVTNVFIEEICKSVPQVPASFRYICHTITTAVTTRFPEAKFTAVGAFIFLRFFCPAIVAPDSEGLVKSIPKRGMRRGLLLIAKVVQNLANNVLFGAKEPYMIPLNDFLTLNIYRVTTFLRDISSPISIPDQAAAVEVFDFGSCIALHRFMYDHWEVVRQKLLHPRITSPVAQNSATPKYTANDLKAPVAEFSALIPTLGAPPLDFSWTRPQLQATIQPSYYRFQQFMLRNSGRSVEPITSARIVYDGGESKDGMPVICVILRNINAETIDIELLIYCFLKIAGRMWSKPFGLLIDATSYTIGNELPDDLPKKVDALSPPEMLANMKRFYVYNMNSAYRKYFRRMVRHAYKDDTSGFHPKNIEYTLLGNLSELERHFHLPSLHLPKDTMSLVADSRFVFQPVTRLSKTKGRIDVVIKIGSQYIQITTTKKQDILPGLRMQAVVNDIFSLSEIEEANASFHTEEENAFGIKTENGKVAMFFSSPRRADILHHIKSAKSKSMKDSRPSPLSERVIRPEDVPGTLLNIALMNMGSADQSLRISAYNLLCALCQTFRFKVDRQFVSAKGLSIPADSLNLIVGVSEKLAANEPQLTFDFLTEFFVGWAKSPLQQRPLSILYMAPWLVNLHSQVLALDGDSERGKERLAGIARKLIEITVNETILYSNFQQNAWSVISRDESLLEVFFEELIKSAINYGFGSAEAEVIGSIAASFGTLTMRGKIIARVRKALNRTSLRPTRHLKDNVIWKEMCVLLRICLAISFDSRAQAQMFLPELFHIITMVVNCGSTNVRTTVHSLLINTVHSICTSFPLDDENLGKLKAILASLSEPKLGLLFSIHRQTSRDGTIEENRTTTESNSSTSSTETITNLLLEIISIAAPSVDMANIWRARWMSLVASTAFQNNPAIQPRAFAVMGCLAREDVDDDLLYQVLVALRSALARFVEQGDAEMLVSIITSLTKMANNLPPSSRYLHQMFWLAMSLIRVGPPSLFNCSAGLLQAVLRVIASSDEFKDGRMAVVLMQGRFTVEEAAAAVDDLFGINFEMAFFAYSACFCIVKGLSDPTTRAVTLRTFTTFLEVVTTNIPETEKGEMHSSYIPYLSCLVPRAANADDWKDIWLGGVPMQKAENIMNWSQLIQRIIATDKKELLLCLALTVIDFRTSDESIQTAGLQLFEHTAAHRPEVFILMHDRVMAELEEILVSSQSQTMLKATHEVIRKIAGDRRFSDRQGTQDVLDRILESIGFSGIWSSTTFKRTSNDQERMCVDRLIELIIA